MNHAVVAKDVSVILGGNVVAIDGISLELAEGKATGFIGPSGAGKTTLIRSIVGRTHLSSGEISIFGKPAGSPELRSQMSYMTQELSVYSDLTVRENLEYFATMCGIKKSNVKDEVRRILREVELEEKESSLVRNLSGGQKQRASLSVALLGKPKLMVLDEPTIGLDPVLREKLWKLFHSLTKQGTTLIVSSHSMDEANRCDDLILIRSGKLLSHSTPDDLMKQTNSKSIEESFLKLVGDSE
ncbi:MAG: ABC transporter ATP-binding protein [Candidatus Saccharimonadales bacterium]